MDRLFLVAIEINVGDGSIAVYEDMFELINGKFWPAPVPISRTFPNAAAKARLRFDFKPLVATDSIYGKICFE
jgi:hypothetical protein